MAILIKLAVSIIQTITEIFMRKTSFGGILLLFVLTVAMPAKAAEQEALPAAQAVETLIIQEEASDPVISEDAPSSTETAAEDSAQVQSPGENDAAPRGEPADISGPENNTELKDVPEPNTDTIPEDRSDPDSGSIPESSSDLNSDSIPGNGSDMNSDSGSGNASDPAEKPESELRSPDEILSEEAVSDPNEQNIGVVNAQDSGAVTKQASNAAASGIVSAAGAKTSDRIHFITLNGEKYDSDAILVESNGLYGLIDASCPSSPDNEYVDSIANGLAVVRYLTDNNVDRLRFVLATHNHFDHVGGMPDIAASGLVDNSTVYFYKPYETSDDQSSIRVRYCNEILEAMAAHGAALINVQIIDSGMIKECLGADADYVEDPEDSAGDHIAFKMGDFLIRLFNLHTESHTNENLNSIVTTVQKNEMRAVLMADMEMSDNMESRIVDCIIRNDGTSRTDVYKMGHHHFDSSNSMDTIKTLNPGFCVQSTSSTTYRSWSGMVYNYFLNKRGNTLYRTSLNAPGIIADFGKYKVSLLKKASDGTMAAATPWKIKIQYDGFYKWYPDEDSYNLTGTRLTYFKSGEAVKCWFKVGNNWYYANDDFIIQTGWQKLDGKKYYFNECGVMQTGWLSSEDSWYYLDSSGAMRTGWLNNGGKWYYLDGTGAMVTGWLNDSDRWYYLDSNGAMATGWISVRGKWYYLDSSGAMQTGWLWDYGTWYYLDSSGAMKTGWLRDGGKWYFLNSSGAMATGWIRDDGIWYYLDSSGVMQTGWLKYGGKWYYLDCSGAMVTNMWIGDYYLKSNGEMAVSQRINGYYVGADGKWIRNK